jgi:hypothetical protein
MNSEPRKVIEYWKRHDPKYARPAENGTVVVTDSDAYNTWARDRALEIDIRPDWVDP